MNNIIMVGRIFQLRKNEIIIAVNSNKKDKKKNFIHYKVVITVANGIGKKVLEYCHQGDIIGIKGHIEDNNKIVADKVSFLSSAKN